MWITTRLLVMYVLFNVLNYTQTFRNFQDMNWTKNPATAWSHDGRDTYNLLHVILLLNVKNYSDSGLEKKLIATGVLIDNSRILTSYNPFRKLIESSIFTDNIVALLPTGYRVKQAELLIANIVCGRQIAYVSDLDNHIWLDLHHSPLHDLIVLRMEEEVGMARVSKALGAPIYDDYFDWLGELELHSSIITFLAGRNDQIGTEIQITSLGYRNKKEMKRYDSLVRTVYEEDDAVLADCEEWMPRQWGIFICIRNIDNFPGLGSGATLFSKSKLFGIGSFAMFRNDTGILVFTDVRYYNELIMKTCGDEEFT